MATTFGTLPQQVERASAPPPPPPEPVPVESPNDPLVQTRRGVGREMLATMERIRGEAEQPQLNPLLSTVMVGNALSANRANEKRLSEKAAEADQNQKITLNGDGTFDIKGGQAADLIATAKTQSAGTLAGVYAVLDKLGLTPRHRADDPELDNGMTYDEVYRGAIELGASPKVAKRQAEKIMRDPKLQAEAARQLRERRSADAIERYKVVQPIINDEEQRQNRTRLEADAARQAAGETRRNFEAFLGNNLVDLGTEDDAAKVGRERVEAGGGKWTESMDKEIRSAYRGQRTKAITERSKTVNTRVNGLRDEDVRGYKPNQRGEFIANQEEELGPLTAAQRIRFEKRFDGLQEEIRIAADKERRSQERFDATMSKFATSSQEKPLKLAIGDAKVVPAEQLIQWVGDPKVDQPQLVITMRRRMESVSPESDDWNDSQLRSREEIAKVESIRQRAGLTRADLRNPEKINAAIDAKLINGGDAEQLAVALERIAAQAKREQSMQSEYAALRDKLLVVDGKAVPYRRKR